MFNNKLRQYFFFGGGKKKLLCITGCELVEEEEEEEEDRERLSVLRVTRPMYNDVWQRGDSSNAPIRKIICRTNYVEKKIKNKLNPFAKIKYSK